MIKFNDERHEYSQNGIIIPSVTQVLTAAGLYDMFGKVNRDVLEAAQVKGKYGHLATEFYDNKTLDITTVHEIIIPYLDGWIKFRKDTGFKPRVIEERVYSKKHNYAGTVDRIGPLDAETVVDIKLGELTPAAALQTAAYLEAYNSDKPPKDKAKDRLIVQLRNDGTYRLPKKSFYSKEDFTVFLACLNIKNWRARHGK